jgi:hypothetical protein
MEEEKYVRYLFFNGLWGGAGQVGPAGFEHVQADERPHHIIIVSTKLVKPMKVWPSRIL